VHNAGGLFSNVNLRLIVPGGFHVHFLHRYRRNLYFITVLCSCSTQLSADKTEGCPRASSQIFRPRESGLQGLKPQGHYSPPSSLFLSFDCLPPSLLHLRGSISGDSSSHHEPVAGNRASLNHHTTLESPTAHT